MRNRGNFKLHLYKFEINNCLYDSRVPKKQLFFEIMEIIKIR